MQTVDEHDKEFKQIALRMNIMIVSIIVMILGIFWMFPFHIYIRLGMTGLMAISLYYQLMAYKVGIGNANMLGMKTQERMINEMGYQVTKRGYNILFKYARNNSEEIVKLKSSDMPRWKLKIVKWISILHVLIKPAWGYREFDEEDDIDEALKESWYELNEKKYI